MSSSPSASMSLTPGMLLVLLLAACGGPAVERAQGDNPQRSKARQGRCLADVGCPEPAAIPRCTGPAPSLTVEELSASVNFQGTLDDRGEYRPYLEPGELVAEGHAHVAVQVCTAAACRSGTCCNHCGGNAILTSSPRFDPSSAPRGSSLVIGHCQGDDSQVCCSVPTSGTRLRVTFRYDGEHLQAVRSCKP